MPQRAACVGLTLALALWVGAAAAGERVIKDRPAAAGVSAMTGATIARRICSSARASAARRESRRSRRCRRRVQAMLIDFLDRELGTPDIARATLSRGPLRLLVHLVMSQPEYQLG